MPAPKGFKEIKRLMPKGQATRSCARKSYGLTSEKKGVRVLVCCRKGDYISRTGRCQKTVAVAVFKRKRS